MCGIQMKLSAEEIIELFGSIAVFTDIKTRIVMAFVENGCSMNEREQCLVESLMIQLARRIK